MLFSTGKGKARTKAALQDVMSLPDCETLPVQSRRVSGVIIEISKECEQPLLIKQESEEVIYCQEITPHQLVLSNCVPKRLYCLA